MLKDSEFDDKLDKLADDFFKPFTDKLEDYLRESKAIMMGSTTKFGPGDKVKYINMPDKTFRVINYNTTLDAWTITDERNYFDVDEEWLELDLEAEIQELCDSLEPNISAANEYHTCVAGMTPMRNPKENETFFTICKICGKFLEEFSPED